MEPALPAGEKFPSAAAALVSLFEHLARHHARRSVVGPVEVVHQEEGGLVRCRRHGADGTPVTATCRDPPPCCASNRVRSFRERSGTGGAVRWSRRIAGAAALLVGVAI